MRRASIAYAALLLALLAGCSPRIDPSSPESTTKSIAEIQNSLPEAKRKEFTDALAVVIPNVEEFGIVAVEAQATGRPVLAVAAGGAVETVIPGVTGELVEPEDLAEAMREVDFTRYDPRAARQSAVRFSPAGFRMVLRSEVARLTGFE